MLRHRHELNFSPAPSIGVLNWVNRLRIVVVMNGVIWGFHDSSFAKMDHPRLPVVTIRVAGGSFNPQISLLLLLLSFITGIYSNHCPSFCDTLE